MGAEVQTKSLGVDLLSFEAFQWEFGHFLDLNAYPMSISSLPHLQNYWFRLPDDIPGVNMKPLTSCIYSKTSPEDFQILIPILIPIGGETIDSGGLYGRIL